MFNTMSRNIYTMQRLSSIKFNQNRCNPTMTQKRSLSTFNIISCASAASTVTLAGWLATRYKVARPGEYLVRTGLFLGDDIDISKQAFLLPYQTFTRINLEPATYHVSIDEAMSSDLISFNLPLVFTIGPKDDKEALKKYAKLLQQSTSEDLKLKIIGIIHGEARIECGATALDDLFNNRQKFKEKIVDKINGQLDDFGLYIYNANVEELKDMKDSKYFYHLRQHALEGAQTTAKIAISEKKRESDIGIADNDSATRKQLAEFEKNAKLVENDRTREIVESDTMLSVARSTFDKQKQIAEYEAKALSEKRQLELQQEVEEYRNKQETARLRARDVASANVTAEAKIKISEGDANSDIKLAEGRAQSLRINAAAEAEAIRLTASATADSIKMKAEATFIERENEAKGILKLREAEAQGLERLIASAGSVDQLNSYLIVHNGMLEKIAEQQASAVRDMKPIINLTNWQTGSNINGENASLMNVVQDLVRTGVPLVESVKTSTGIDLLKSYRKD
jgi:flotillin